MLWKQGVYYDERLKRPMRRALPIIDKTFIKITNMEAVCTSTYEGTHSPGSLHYAGLACDFRISHLPVKNGNPDVVDRDDVKLGVKKALADRFGRLKYDVLFSPDGNDPDACLHVEYDPK
jgi:hypothetical protein